MEAKDVPACVLGGRSDPLSEDEPPVVLSLPGVS